MRYDGWLLFMLVLLSTLVILQVVIKLILYRRVTFVLQNVEMLLRLSEAHAEINDSQKERTLSAIESIKTEATQVATRAAAVVKESTEEVKSAVAEVPVRVIEKIQEAGHDSLFDKPILDMNKRPNMGTSGESI